jgi:hypothetical protein
MVTVFGFFLGLDYLALANNYQPAPLKERWKEQNENHRNGLLFSLFSTFKV